MPYISPVAVGCVFLFSAAIVVFAWFKRRELLARRDKKRKAISENWGQPVFRDRVLPQHDSWFTSHPHASGHVFVDDQTWDDLELGNVFDSLDRTLSTPGDWELYRMFRFLETDTKQLSHRDELANRFENDIPLRTDLQLRLSYLGRSTSSQRVVDILVGDSLRTCCSNYIVGSKAIAVCIAICFLASSFVGQIGIQIGTLSFLALILANTFVHYRAKNIFVARLYAARYLGRMVGVCGRLIPDDVEGDNLPEQRSGFQRWVQATKGLASVEWFGVPIDEGAMGLADVVREFLAILFLTEVRSFNFYVLEINKNRQALQEMFVAVGELDAILSIASFRHGSDGYCRPVFGDSKSFCLRDVRHPLLKSAASTSLTLDKKSCLITGSNMAGKSTFLRAVGINAILAQSIYTCTSNSYTAPFMNVMSSINPSDDLSQGNSYFLAEAKRILAIIEASLGGKSVVLALIDEPLRGTNSVERNAAVNEVMTYLATRCNAIIVAATHDVSLAKSLAADFENFHFTGSVDDDGLHFDYVLRPGVATSTNALQLLKYLGFPEEIVNGTIELAKKQSI